MFQWIIDPFGLMPLWVTCYFVDARLHYLLFVGLVFLWRICYFVDFVFGLLACWADASANELLVR